MHVRDLEFDYWTLLFQNIHWVSLNPKPFNAQTPKPYTLDFVFAIHCLEEETACKVLEKSSTAFSGRFCFSARAPVLEGLRVRGLGFRAEGLGSWVLGLRITAPRSWI